MSDQPKARSPELTGGEGFTYEDSVAVIYLSALLRQEAAPSTCGAVVRVAVQQKRQGDPLDDLIVDAEEAGELSRLSLQVKRHVIASSSNGDMQEIVREAVLTRAKSDFRAGLDRYGFATRSISINGFDDLNRMIGFAAASTNGQEYTQRFAPGVEANARMIAMRADLRPLITPADDDAEWDFYRHLVALRLDNLGDGEDRLVDLSNRLAAVAESEGSNIVEVFAHEVRKGEGKAKVWTRNSLISDIRSKVQLRAAPSYERDLKALTELAQAYVQEIRADIEGVSLDRSTLVDAAEEAAASRIYSNINGAPGCGKSVILRRCVERSLARGPVLFLKSDRLEGSGWRSFAQKQGLQHLDAAALLGEIGGTGTPILYIDGIDRIKAEHRGIVTDLLTTLQSSPHLAHWRVLVTSRDQGLEPLRSWIPASFYASTGIGAGLCWRDSGGDPARGSGWEDCGRMTEATPAAEPPGTTVLYELAHPKAASDGDPQRRATQPEQLRAPREIQYDAQADREATLERAFRQAVRSCLRGRVNIAIINGQRDRDEIANQIAPLCGSRLSKGEVVADPTPAATLSVAYDAIEQFEFEHRVR